MMVDFVTGRHVTASNHSIQGNANDAVRAFSGREKPMGPVETLLSKVLDGFWGRQIRHHLGVKYGTVLIIAVIVIVVGLIWIQLA